MVNDENKAGIWFTLGIFIGGLLGFISVLTMSSKDGKKLAKELWQKIEEHLDQLERETKEKTETLLEKKDEAISQAIESSDTVLQTLQQAFESATHDAEQSLHKIESGISGAVHSTFGKESSPTSTKSHFKKNGEPLK